MAVRTCPFGISCECARDWFDFLKSELHNLVERCVAEDHQLGSSCCVLLFEHSKSVLVLGIQASILVPASSQLRVTLVFPSTPQVTQLFGQYVTLMLQTYAANPAVNWKEKDCAIYLVVALTVRQKTAAQGATATNQLVNIGDFFTAQIEPELKKTDGSPVLRADALKFVTTFRSQVRTASCWFST